MEHERILDVMITTHGPTGLDMIEKMELPRIKGVTYVVSWQPIGRSSAIPDKLRRDDIEIYTTHTIGLSVNRNNALRNTKATYCLVSDNDLKYTPAQLQSVIEAFKHDPELDLASFMYTGDNNKQYPENVTLLDIPFPKNFYSTSFEVAFRRKSVVGKIWYNELFGIGAPLAAGEDTLFLYDCIKSGLVCKFIPIVITHHEGLTTGNRKLSSGVLMSEGALLRKIYPISSLLRIPLFAYRRSKSKQADFFSSVYWLIRGYFYPLS